MAPSAGPTMGTPPPPPPPPQQANPPNQNTLDSVPPEIRLHIYEFLVTDTTLEVKSDRTTGEPGVKPFPTTKVRQLLRRESKAHIEKTAPENAPDLIFYIDDFDHLLLNHFCIKHKLVVEGQTVLNDTAQKRDIEIRVSLTKEDVQDGAMLSHLFEDALELYPDGVGAGPAIYPVIAWAAPFSPRYRIRMEDDLQYACKCLSKWIRRTDMVRWAQGFSSWLLQEIGAAIDAIYPEHIKLCKLPWCEDDDCT